MKKLASENLSMVQIYTHTHTNTVTDCWEPFFDIRTLTHAHNQTLKFEFFGILLLVGNSLVFSVCVCV